MVDVYTFYIDNINLNNLNILNIAYTKRDEKSFTSQDIIQMEDYTLDAYGDWLNPINQHSIFYGRDLTDFLFFIYENDLLIFTGYINDISFDCLSQMASIKIKNNLNVLLNKTHIFFGSDITIAKAFEQIMINENLERYIDKGYIGVADLIQTENNYLCDIVFNNNTTILNSIQTLASYAASNVYTSQNNLVFDQYDSFFNVQNPFYVLHEEMILDDIQITTDSENIENAYELNYAGDTFLSQDYTDIGDKSIEKYGKRASQTIDFNNDSNIITNINAAFWLGKQIILKNKDIKTYLELTLDKYKTDIPVTIGNILKFNTEMNIEGIFEIISVESIEDTYKIKLLRF